MKRKPFNMPRLARGTEVRFCSYAPSIPSLPALLVATPLVLYLGAQVAGGGGAGLSGVHLPTAVCSRPPMPPGGLFLFSALRVPRHQRVAFCLVAVVRLWGSLARGTWNHYH